MRRREFIVGAAGLVCPLRARAQQPAVPVIGFLSSTSAEEYAHVVAAFRQGLKEVELIEGRNLAIEFRWADGQYNRLAPLADDLVRRKVAVIAAIGGNNPALAAKAATSTIPIVSVFGSDPIKLGLVANLHNPGTNVTGISLLASDLATKRFELLSELVGTLPTIGFIINPDNPNATPDAGEVEIWGRASGRQIVVERASTEGDLESAFATLVQQRVGAVVVSADGFFTNRRKQLVGLAARHAVPTIYPWPDFVEAGGLMSYGTSLPSAYRQVGIYTGRILKGASPADLPVQQATKYSLLINLKTARRLGLTIPLALLARADDVIE